VKAPQYNQSWSDEVKAVYQHDIEEIWDPGLAPHLWNQYHNHLEIYCGLAGEEPKNILDIGCAQATLALTLAEKGHRVTAFDIRQPFLDYAKSRYTHGDISFVCGNALELELKEKFDIIFANQILEHLVYPVEFTLNLRKSLKPGGLLVMSTPNGHYIKNSLQSFAELGDPQKWEHMQFTADGDGHFFAYHDVELKKILNSAGLKHSKITWFETPWISGHMKVRYLHKYLPSGLIQFLDQLTLMFPFMAKRLSHQLLAIGRVD